MHCKDMRKQSFHTCVQYCEVTTVVFMLGMAEILLQ